MKALVIDDNELVRSNVAEVLRADAWDVAAYCAGGVAAWAIWNRSSLTVAAPRDLTGNVTT